MRCLAASFAIWALSASAMRAPPPSMKVLQARTVQVGDQLPSSPAVEVVTDSGAPISYDEVIQQSKRCVIIGMPVGRHAAI
jgi:hypothetical protein